MTVAPQHERGLEELDPYVIEGVKYSPLKMTFLCNYDKSLEVRCNECTWSTTVGQLPEDSGRVMPDMCPDCVKNDQLGFVRCESPADGTFPSDWTR
jgi:hypothetical protein